MRIVLLATGDFATDSLRAMHHAGHELVAVVTQPARRAGRGGKLRQTPAALAAVELGIQPWECENVNEPDAIQTLANLKPDAIVVIDFGQFVTRAIRELPTYDTINLHGSILPALRGAAPVQRAILDGLPETGVTTFSLVKEMDAGPIYRTAESVLGEDERGDELRSRLAREGAQLLCETLDGLARGDTPTDQDESLATHAAKLSKSDGLLDFTRPADELHRVVRGTYPWPGARAHFVKNDTPLDVQITRTRVHSGTAGQAGTLDSDLFVQCSDGRLEIITIKPAGKREMNWPDFVNGQRVQPGDRFESLTENSP
jgi:methionyl-tRNA formyltransferase